MNLKISSLFLIDNIVLETTYIFFIMGYVLKLINKSFWYRVSQMLKALTVFTFSLYNWKPILGAWAFHCSVPTCFAFIYFSKGVDILHYWHFSLVWTTEMHKTCHKHMETRNAIFWNISFSNIGIHRGLVTNTNGNLIIKH